jgi:hypothetical protein
MDTQIKLNPLYENSFIKLMKLKNDSIELFKSKITNIMLTFTLSDYLFYRDCFSSESNIFPFQFITVNSLEECIKTEYLHKDKIINQNEDYLIWFNVGSCASIVSWTYVLPEEKKYIICDKSESYRKLDQKLADLRDKISTVQYFFNQESGDMTKDININTVNIEDLRNRIKQTSHPRLRKILTENNDELFLSQAINYYNKNKNKYILLKQKIALKEMSKQDKKTFKINTLLDSIDHINYNEIDRIIMNMSLYISALISLPNFDHDESPYGCSCNEDDIISKIKLNMSKTHKNECDIFPLTSESTNLGKNKDMSEIFTIDMVKQIVNSCDTSTTEYNIGKRNGEEMDINGIKCKAYFGFINL